jgi:hypothetical protein
MRQQEVVDRRIDNTMNKRKMIHNGRQSTTQIINSVSRKDKPFPAPSVSPLPTSWSSLHARIMPFTIHKALNYVFSQTNLEPLYDSG